MKRAIILMSLFTFAFAVGCSKDEAESAADAATNAATNAADGMKNGASDMMQKAEAGVDAAAEQAKDMAHGATESLAEGAVATCQRLAASGAWESALEACEKAHEMRPDDLGLEHAFQQAKAAAGL